MYKLLSAKFRVLNEAASGMQSNLCGLKGYMLMCPRQILRITQQSVLHILKIWQYPVLLMGAQLDVYITVIVLLHAASSASAWCLGEGL